MEKSDWDWPSSGGLDILDFLSSSDFLSIDFLDPLSADFLDFLSALSALSPLVYLDFFDFGGFSSFSLDFDLLFDFLSLIFKLQFFKLICCHQMIIKVSSSFLYLECWVSFHDTLKMFVNEWVESREIVLVIDHGCVWVFVGCEFNKHIGLVGIKLNTWSFKMSLHFFNLNISFSFGIK